MMRYVALLRAVNVGGTGKLPMAELVQLGRDAGFTQVQTYIASGNLVFSGPLPEDATKAALEAALLRRATRPVAVFVRSADDMAQLVANNPFVAHPGNRTAVLFMDRAVSARDLTEVKGCQDEEMHLGLREIYLHFPRGMGTSKLKLAAMETGTLRNMNTVARLAQMAAAQ